jgi:hypothetical protein
MRRKKRKNRKKESFEKYKIVLFENNKKLKVFAIKARKETILEYWHEFKTQRKPRFVKEFRGRNRPLKYELMLLYPKDKTIAKTFIKDELGRNREAELVSETHKIKEIIPYWVEETVYDFDLKNRIRYHEALNFIKSISELTQIFTLNNKVFIYNENLIKVYGNVNKLNAEKFFNLLKEDLLDKKIHNFLFVKDVTTYQRTQLYNLLEEKGFKRSELFRHYSY